MARKSKMITKEEDIKLLLNITSKDFTKSFMMEMFGEFNRNGKPYRRFNSYDIIKIPKGSYGPEGKKNRNDFYTTVGLWVYNKFMIEPYLFDEFKYINTTIDKKFYKNMCQRIVYGVMEDRIKIDDYKTFINRTEFLMPFVVVLSANDTEKILTISTEIEPEKKKLIKQYKDKIDKGDVGAVSEMESKLIDTVVDKLKDDPSMDSYISGSRASIGNNLKNMYIMKGAVKDHITGKFNVATSNYNDGISKDEYHIFANSLAAGPYKRGQKTAIGGTWEKQYVSNFQHIKILPEGTDCGTKKHITVTLDDPKLYLYSYIIEGDKLVLLDSTNMDKYKGKKVKLRFSSMCESKDGICSVCAGKLFNMLKLTNVGLALSLIPSNLKNVSMKSFHDSVEKLHTIDVSKAFGFDGTRKIR